MLKFRMCRLRLESRQKVAMGYYVIGAFTLTISILTLLELKFIERKITSYERASELFESIMEIRRFEKNYFLYGQEADYNKAVGYVQSAHASLATNMDELSEILPPQQLAALKSNLDKYKDVLRQYANSSDRDRKLFFEGSIRKTGRDITDAAHHISAAKKKNIQRTLRNSRRFLIISIVLLAILGAGIFQMLSKTAAHAQRIVKKID